LSVDRLKTCGFVFPDGVILVFDKVVAGFLKASDGLVFDHLSHLGEERCGFSMQEVSRVDQLSFK
jgi:hypothetical protein